VEKSILVVEDHAELRDMFAVILKEQGYAVYTADDGCEALKLVEAVRPGIIITDVCMPNMDGIEMIRRLRKRHDGDKVYILVVSAYDSEDMKEAVKAGANQLMHKPISCDSLIGVVNAVFE
jgi:DNA-binding response OmpR family regulator